jgi:multidrug efflux pump subunit AcrB
MSSMIGLLMLVGIVVTNAIVLLDLVETKRKNGMDLNQALMEAAKTRLRPILITAFATIFAFIPLAISTDSSLLVSRGLAITVIGGLTTSGTNFDCCPRFIQYLWKVSTDRKKGLDGWC